MAEVCKDIDKGLADLQAAISRLNNRISQLEQKQKECCEQKKNDDKKNNDHQNNQDNSALEKRVAKLEKNQEALKTGIIQTLNNFADIEDTSREFASAFQGLYEIVVPLIDTVSIITEFLGG